MADEKKKTGAKPKSGAKSGGAKSSGGNKSQSSKKKTQSSAKTKDVKEMELDNQAQSEVLTAVSKKFNELKKENEELKKRIAEYEGGVAEPKAEGESENAETEDPKVAKLTEELNTQADKYQRLMAEFENMRKRTEKESIRQYDIGAKEVLEKLLPVVDNFERAMDSVTEEQKQDAFVQGIERIHKQLEDYLASVKVEPMNAQGTEFNPDLHNAVQQVESDEYEEGTVVMEMQKGYMYKNEVLRYSMVQVAN